MWKVIYELATLKLGQEDLFKEIDQGEEEEEGQEDKEEEEGKEEEKVEEKIEEEKKEEENVEETQEAEIEAPATKQQTEPQVPRPSPPHSSLADQVLIQDVPKIEPQNANPLIVEDIKVIMDQAVEQANLLEHVVLVSEEELKKATSKSQDQPSKQINVEVDTKDKDGHIEHNKGNIPKTPKEEEQQAMHTLVNLQSADSH